MIVVKSEGARAGRAHSPSPPFRQESSWNQPTPFVSERAFLLALCGGPPLEPATPPPSFFKSVPQRVVTCSVPPPRYSLFTQSVVTKPIQSSAPRNVTDSSRDQPCRPKKVFRYSQIQSTATPVSPEAKQTTNSSCKLGLFCTTTPAATRHLPPLPFPSPHRSLALRPSRLHAPFPRPTNCAACTVGYWHSALSAQQPGPGQTSRRMPPSCTQHPAPSTRQRQIKIKRDSSLPSAGTPDSIQCSAQPGFCDKKATSPLNARSSLGHRHNAQNSISTILPFWYSS